MDEQTIKRFYVEKSKEEVKLLCSYTTKKDGFLDMLLSGYLLSSEEVREVLGNVKTHRGSYMGNRGGSHGLNNSISFSTGFVSFKYSDPLIRVRDDYVGGLGVIVPFEKILNYPNLRFSHCSNIGGVESSNLNRDNIELAVHKARLGGVLYDDGYGNVFEVILESELQKDESLLSSSSSFPKVISYPRLELIGDIVIAIPLSERKDIEQSLLDKQEKYKLFLDKVSGKNYNDLRWETIDERDLCYVEKMIPFIEKMVKPVEMDKLPIVWYKERNLDLCLQHLAILKK